MIIATSTKTAASLDLELCRAMYEKDPDKMIELVSKWLEVNRLQTSDRFCVPEYLSDVLSRADRPVGTWRPILAS